MARPGEGPGSGAGPSREGTCKHRGGCCGGRLARLPPRSLLPQPPARVARGQKGSSWGGAGPGRAGLGASPPGAAPSDRLPPPPPAPREPRESAPSAGWGTRWPRVLAGLSSVLSPGMGRPAP